MEKMIIPEWLEETLTEELGNIAEKLESEYETMETEIYPIEYKSRDGFWAYTNGGLHFRMPVLIEACESSGHFPVNAIVTKELEDTIDYCYTEARKSFIEKNRVNLAYVYTKKQMDSNSDEINYHNLYEVKRGQLAEELSEYEREWMDYTTFFIQCRAQFYSADNFRSETGKDEIYFMGGINMDYDYGRDKGIHECYEKTVPVEDLTPDMVKEIFKEMNSLI